MGDELPEDLTKLKVPQLRKHLSDRGLNDKGRKADLVERLQEAVSAPADEEEPAAEAAEDAEVAEAAEAAEASGLAPGDLAIVSIELEAEMAVVRNTTDHAISLEGCVVKDVSGGNMSLPLPAWTIEAGASFKMWTAPASKKHGAPMSEESTSDVFWRNKSGKPRSQSVLNDEDDGLVFEDSAGVEIAKGLCKDLSFVAVGAGDLAIESIDLDGEKAVFTNTSGKSVSLEGCVMHDLDGGNKSLGLPAIVVAAGSQFTFWCAPGGKKGPSSKEENSANVFWRNKTGKPRASAVLNNEDDGLKLVTSEGVVVVEAQAKAFASAGAAPMQENEKTPAGRKRSAAGDDGDSAPSSSAKRRRWGSTGERKSSSSSDVAISSTLLKDLVPAPAAAAEEEKPAPAAASTSQAMEEDELVDTESPAAEEQKDEYIDDSDANEPTKLLHITQLKRPFSIQDLRKLLEQTGTITDGEHSFEMDRFRTQAFVEFETVEQAAATLKAIRGVTWPVGGQPLRVQFVKHNLLANPPPAGSASQDNSAAKQPRVLKKITAPEPAAAAAAEDASGSAPKPGEGANLLETLFRKTKATPPIYWLPLSQEELDERKARREERRREREKEMAEREQRRSRRSPSRSRSRSRSPDRRRR